MVTVAPDRIVRLSQNAAAPMTGKLVIPTDGMITFVEAVGTIPLHQFNPVFQSVLVDPSQVPPRQLVLLTLSTPVAVVPKKVEFLITADRDAVPPYEFAAWGKVPRIKLKEL